MKPLQSMLKIVKKVKWDVAVRIYLAIRKVLYLKYVLYYIVVASQNEFFVQPNFSLHIMNSSPSHICSEAARAIVASLITILT